MFTVLRILRPALRTMPDRAVGLLATSCGLLVLAQLPVLWRPWPHHWLTWVLWGLWLASNLGTATIGALAGAEYRHRLRVGP